ncbi:hypothetical protein BJ322DRAFT_288059 [Thelephora terrestris]|uniref:F-box domain-containing protein n=1 Tax=Thelephora terrestris TaxID=56493 RepID=A0A9P6L3R4_9AGAM|nr:hypothetical protein BJ322DRAFT_288059 [Thelephora terrestris]
MSHPLPPEIFDLIIDCLCNEPATLKACCLVSKSWVPRTRKHLFASVYLHICRSTIRLWMKAFPDPSNSPAHYTRHLWISEQLAAESTWIRFFCRVERLTVHAFDWDETVEAPLVRLHGLSPTLKYLHLVHYSIPLSDILDLVCSFPLLEDLTLRCEGSERDRDGWVAPSTSPKFTGTLFLMDEIRSAARGLLALPGGLHFTNVVLLCPIEHAESAMDLVSRCSDTLESLCINYYPPRSSEMPPPLDLSRAAKLKHVEFRFEMPDVQWIVATLETAETNTLQQITLFSSVPFDTVEEVIRMEWQNLDHLLARLWTAHSIVPELKYTPTLEMELVDLGEAAPGLLPKLVNMGVVCEAGDYWQSL